MAVEGDRDGYLGIVRDQSALLRVVLYILDKNVRNGN